MIGVDLGVGPKWQVKRCARSGQKRRFLEGLEDLRGDLARGAVDATTGDVAAPRLNTLSRVVKPGEVLAIEPALAHEGDLILDTRLVLGRADASRVDEHAACLDVVDEGVGECGAERV